MQSQLDQAITAASAAEATYVADQTTVTNIQAAIAAASSPLAPAQAQVATDVKAYNDSLSALISAAQAAMIPTS